MSTLEGKALTVQRKKFRRDVAAGLASWSDRRPAATMAVHPEMSAGEPVAPRRVAFTNSTTRGRRPFGVGILRSLPTYRMPGEVTHEDADWWAAESRREEDRMFDRLAADSAAMDRLEQGLEPY